MVISKKWKTAYELSGKYAAHAKSINILAAFAIQVGRSFDRLEQISLSDESDTDKVVDTLCVLESAGLRTLVAAVQGPVHLLAKGLHLASGYTHIPTLLTQTADKVVVSLQHISTKYLDDGEIRRVITKAVL